MSTMSWSTEQPSRLAHGGRVRAAAVHYDIPLDDWLDLSTGINPDGWPVPELPASIWTRLPEDGDGLEAAARAYYGSAHLLPVAGSQAAIQALPRLRSPARVHVLEPGYAEHARAWRRAGHSVTSITAAQLNDTAPRTDVLVLINPNNPTGARFHHRQLLEWHTQLATRGGWLVVDEAFMDTKPEHSLAPYCHRPGLIVLRSLGKFFGLAGARVGFVLAAAALLEHLADILGPWTVAAAARHVAQQALSDDRWQHVTRVRLVRASCRLAKLLASRGLPPAGGTTLFQWIETPDAARLHRGLAHRAILTRLFTDPPSVRFGLPGAEDHWSRLEHALAAVAKVTAFERPPPATETPP